MICNDCHHIHRWTPGEIIMMESCPMLDPDHPAGNVPVAVRKCPDWKQLDPDLLHEEYKKRLEA